MSVLDDLMESAHERVRGLGSLPPERPRPGLDFRSAIAGKDRVSVIAEFKRCSPSNGRIRAEADVANQVRGYVDGGASAISVLTEPTRFRGSYDDLRSAVATVDAAVLMKDFIVAERQIEFAASLGASAVLLIVRCLSDARLGELAALCGDCGMTPLVECHDAREIERALRIDDAVIGVNHRDLSTLVIDRERGRELFERIPSDRVVVSESGVESPNEIRELSGIADAVLVGTALMRASDPRKFLREALA